MKFTHIVTAITLSLTTACCWADTASKAQAMVLLQSMGMDKAMNASIEQMMDVQLKQNPSLLPFRGVMGEFFRKHMSFDALKDQFAEIYGNAFTSNELEDIIRFYQTPTGKKSIQLMPQLMSQGAEIGMAQVRRHMPELQQMVQQEAERLKKR
jgi:uncharacterized protein